MTECTKQGKLGSYVLPEMVLPAGLSADMPSIKDTTLISKEPTNVMKGQVVEGLETFSKDLYSGQKGVPSTTKSGFYSIVFGGEPVRYYTEVEKEKKTMVTNSEQSEHNHLPGINVLETKCNMHTHDINPVTHIEIIRESPRQSGKILKSKPSLSRRVTGANRVVPLITSMWQKGELKAIEPTLCATYKAVLDNPESTDERQCEICHHTFLSATEVEVHVKEVHRKEYIMPQQCFVCTKKYVFESQLKRHLSLDHGIQYPEMICKICFMEFNTTIEQKAHERKHDKIYTCHFCSSKFASEYSCQKHYSEHLMHKKPFLCTKCGKRFCRSVCLDVHQNRHRHHQCSVCCAHFEDELQFVLHVKSHGPESEIGFLNIIERMDQEESQLEEIMNIYFRTSNSCSDSQKHKEVDQDVSKCVKSMVNAVSDILESDAHSSELSQKTGVECKLCGLEMSSAKDLFEHRLKSHLRSRTCPFCGKRSRSVSQTWRHIVTHIGRVNSNKGVTQTSKADGTEVNEPQSAFECHICNKIFPTKGKHNHHLETIHKMDIVPRPYNCPVCPKKFQYKTSRERHILVHSEDKSGCWKCAICDQAFLRPKFLSRHIKDHEAENKCHVCNKAFPRKSKLKLHLKCHNSLNAKSRLKCTVCPVSCRTISGLREHTRTHTGERPYDCDQCHMKFKRLQALKKHVTCVHNGPGLTSYSCSICAVEFNKKGNLMRHILSIHHAVRRFICGVCGNRYGQNQDLRKHLKSKHLVEMPSIPSTNKKPANEVYIFPPLDTFPLSHAQEINIIVAEEMLKIQQLNELWNSLMKSTNPQNYAQNMCTVQTLKVKPVSNQRKKHMSVTIQSQEIPESVMKILQMKDSRTEESTANFVHCQSFIPLHKIQCCCQCNKVVFGENECILDGKNIFKCKKCKQEALLPNVVIASYKCGICSVDFSTHNYLSDHMINNHGLIIPEQRNTSLDTLSPTISAYTNNEIPNQVGKESLDISTAVFGNQDLGCAGSQMVIQNLTFQPNSAVSLPITFSNQNLLMTTSASPLIAFQTTGFNSVLTNNPSTPATLTLSDLGNVTDAIVPLPPPSEMFADSGDHWKSSKTMPEVGKNDETPINISNNITCFDVSSSDVPPAQISEFQSDFISSNNFQCQVCGKRHDRIAALERHLKIHSGVKPFKCDICDKKFIEKHNLKVHMRVHTGERPYKCLQCSKQFRYLKDLADHKKKHQGIMPHACSECGKRFLRLRELLRHKNTHTGEKRYRCPVCDKAFLRLDQMKMVHMKIHESQQRAKSHTCETCNKCFSSKHSLEKHNILHTGKKKHICDICGKAFALEIYLKSHIKTHKKQENYIQCPKCPRKFASENTLQIHDGNFHVRQHRTAKANEEKEQSINTNRTTATEYTEPALINAEVDIFNIEDQNYDLLESKECNAVIYLQMLPEIEMELPDEIQ